jgi:branched-chain amino acid transport system ATP-binding protein
MQLVHEDRRICGSLSVEENIVLAGLTATNKWPLDRVYGMFPRLKERRTSRGTDLSGGEQQILAIARARAQSEDHPARRPVRGACSGHRPGFGGRLPRADSGRQTIVLVEQNLTATLALAERVYIISNGHIAHEGPAAEITAHRDLLQRYMGV